MASTRKGAPLALFGVKHMESGAIIGASTVGGPIWYPSKYAAKRARNALAEANPGHEYGVIFGPDHAGLHEDGEVKPS